MARATVAATTPKTITYPSAASAEQMRQLVRDLVQLVREIEMGKKQ